MRGLVETKMAQNRILAAYHFAGGKSYGATKRGANAGFFLFLEDARIGIAEVVYRLVGRWRVDRVARRRRSVRV